MISMQQGHVDRILPRARTSPDAQAPTPPTRFWTLLQGRRRVRSLPISGGPKWKLQLFVRGIRKRLKLWLNHPGCHLTQFLFPKSPAVQWKAKTRAEQPIQI